MSADRQRIELPLGEPRLYLLIDAAKPLHRSYGPGWEKGESGGLLHVMSPVAGGEVRGYWHIGDRLWKRYPDSIGEWPEVDQAVADAMQLEVWDKRRGDIDVPGWLTTLLAKPRREPKQLSLIGGVS